MSLNNLLNNALLLASRSFQVQGSNRWGEISIEIYRQITLWINRIALASTSNSLFLLLDIYICTDCKYTYALITYLIEKFSSKLLYDRYLNLMIKQKAAVPTQLNQVAKTK